MDKEKAFLESRINILEDSSARYSYAFEILMEHFDKLPDDIQKTIDKQLKEIDLW